ncbi:hypothetical protein [Pseudorhizobium pelagicum]|uniref:hypothetical protein n=1 Tax=Pseudorhizobium pelagicum TaxID=1509405 RepID=UPI000ABD9BD2|nr:hypothetical protein [Pseudorhizobium pelagicum]
MTSIAPLTLPQDIQALLDQSARRVGVPLRSPLLDRRKEAVPLDSTSNVIPFRRNAR